MTSSLLLIPSSTESATTAQISVASSGIMRSTPEDTDDFTVKATHVNLCNIMPGYPSYIPNWRNLLQGLGVNTLRIEDGGEGRLGYNINLDPNWAQNLMKVLDTINPDRTATTGYKIYWQCLGAPWESEFGINDIYRSPNDGANDGSGGVGLMSINKVKSMIDKLAGNNALGHNFITDPRIIAWAVGNECFIGTSNGYGGVNTNIVYSWLIQIQDYIRSKGAQVIADAPYVDNWDMNFALTAPLFYGHVNYMETHEYRVQELASTYNYGNLQFNWEGWKTYLQKVLTAQVNAAKAAGFDAEHIVPRRIRYISIIQPRLEHRHILDTTNTKRLLHLLLPSTKRRWQHQMDKPILRLHVSSLSLWIYRSTVRNNLPSIQRNSSVLRVRNRENKRATRKLSN